MLTLPRQITFIEAEVPLELGAIYTAYAGRVAGWAARLGGLSVDAEDIVHEVFLIVHRQLPQFRQEAKLSTWLYRITANVVRDRRRREQRRLFRSWLGAKREPSPVVVTPIEALEQQQSTRLVYEVLDTLKDNHRTVLILFELEGLSGEEISELLDVKIKTIWIWLHRARRHFRDRLAKLHPGEFGPSRRTEP